MFQLWMLMMLLAPLRYSIHVTAAGVHKDVFILNGILIATINMLAGKEGIGDWGAAIQNQCAASGMLEGQYFQYVHDR